MVQLVQGPANEVTRSEYSFARVFLFQDDRFGWADFRREQNFLVGVGLGVDHLGDHLGVEPEHFGRGLDAFGVAVAFGSIDGNFHYFSRGRFKHF